MLWLVRLFWRTEWRELTAEIGLDCELINEHGRTGALVSASEFKAVFICVAYHVGFGPILLQKSFCITERKFSGPWARQSNIYVGDYIIVS